MTEPTRINVGVRAFAALREALGFAETTVSVAPGTDIAGLMARLNELYPRADLAAQRYGVALNRSYAPLTAVLADGDEVALIPPVSGGATGEAAAKLFEISAQPLSLDDVMRRVVAPERGGVTLFAGTVRGVTRRAGEDEIATDYLEYEAYPEMAEEALARIAAEVQARLAERERRQHRASRRPAGGRRPGRGHRSGRVASAGHVRRLPLHHRPGQTDRADLEKRGRAGWLVLGGRAGVSGDEMMPPEQRGRSVHGGGRCGRPHCCQGHLRLAKSHLNWRASE